MISMTHGTEIQVSKIKVNMTEINLDFKRVKITLVLYFYIQNYVIYVTHLLKYTKEQGQNTAFLTEHKTRLIIKQTILQVRRVLLCKHL